MVARQIFDSEIWLYKPSTWKVIWIYIFGNVNHTANDHFERGEGFFNFAQEKRSIGIDITDDIIKKFLQFARDHDMIRTTRSTRGMIIKVNKYDEFQSFDLYRGTTGGTKKAREKHERSTPISNNGNKGNNDIDTETIVSVSAPTPLAPKSKPPKPDPLQPMNLAEAITWFKSSPNRRDLHIIAEWADTIKPDCNNRGQWITFMKRHLRAAQDLAPFTDDQLSKAYSKIVEMRSEKDFKPALETLRKFVT